MTSVTELREYNADGTVHSISECVDGKLHGIVKIYDYDHLNNNKCHLIIIKEYDNDIIQKYTRYHENGIASTVLPYKNGLIDGEVFEYYECGKIKKTKCMSAGKRQGMYHLYTDDGKLVERSAWENNELHGLFEYFENDVLLRTTNYKDGLRHGLETNYENGLLRTEKMWQNGERHGATKEYADGELRTVSYWLNNVNITIDIMYIVEDLNNISDSEKTAIAIQFGLQI